MATSITAARTIIKYLEIDESIVLPQNIETIVLQSTLQWLRFNHLDMRWNATRILFMLNRNPENTNLINQRIINLIDTECVYIKNLILREICINNGISAKTREHVFLKCKNDPCFVVRMVYEEVVTEQCAKTDS